LTSGRNGLRLKPGTLVGQIPGVYGTGRKSAGLGVLERFQGREYKDIEEQVEWLTLLRPKFVGWWQDKDGVGEDCGAGKGT
jgi:hypothetical protein